LDHAFEGAAQHRDVGVMRLVFQRPQYAARDLGDVGVAAPARDGEPARYLQKMTLRLVAWLNLAVSAQQMGAVLAQAPQRPFSLVRARSSSFESSGVQLSR
jgi:hypothetical protein